jgi:hypothetical protein
MDLTDLEYEEMVRADAELTKWRRDTDLPRVRRTVQEYQQEMGREGRYLRLFALYDQLMEAEEGQFWRRKRHEVSAAAGRPDVERAMIAWFIRENEPRIEKMRREIAGIQTTLFHPQSAKRSRITLDMIERARVYPIENFVDARRGMALCIFHDDHNASMYVKNNFVHCFSCGKTADTIDVYRKIHGATFPEAVRALQ